MPFSDQGLQIGFESGTVMARVLKKELDQSSLAGTKVPMDTTPGKSMQEGHGLLREKLFKFFGGHNMLVTRHGRWERSALTRRL